MAFIHFLLTLTAVAGFLSAVGADSSSAVRPVSKAESLERCLEEREVPAKYPQDGDWDEYAATYNIRVPVTPAAITIPKTITDIKNALCCATDHGIKVQPKSGGHSYASFSNGGKDGELVVDLRNFQSVSVDSRTKIAKVAGGVRLGNMATALYQQGKRAVAHGTCAGVGIGGHFLHGGYGFASRAWGLGLDQIVGLDVVLADGKMIHATSKDYPEVYYAMRGAGESIGIAINFYLETHAAPDKVVNFRLDASDATLSTDSTVGAYLTVQDFVQSNAIDRKHAFSISLQYNQFSLSGVYLGSGEEFNKTVKPAVLEAIKDLPNPTLSAQEFGWLESLTDLNDGEPLQISEPYKARKNFFAKSVIVPEPGLSADRVRPYIDYILNTDAPTPFFAYLDLYGGRDSQINTKDANFSSFGHRDSLWVAQHYAWVDNDAVFPDKGITYIDGLNDALAWGVGGGYSSYYGYIDPTLSRKEAHRRYYGRAITEKLRWIKDSIDPNRLFWNPFTICMEYS